LKHIGHGLICCWPQIVGQLLTFFGENLARNIYSPLNSKVWLAPTNIIENSIAMFADPE
jgi:hypothetical protein